VSSPAPTKDTKPGKTQDAAKDDGKPAAGQVTLPDPSAMNIAAIMPPIQTPTDPAPALGQTIATAAISGAAKGAAKNSGVDSNPGTGAANDNRANGETAKPGVVDGKSPAPANGATQDATAANTQPGSNGAQTAGNPQTTSNGDKAAAHDQVQAPVPQTQAPQTQPQLQPQTPVAAIQPPMQPQAPASASASVSQHVQVGPQDSSSADNTLSALAMAIAVKSQSGNKQFDIRLDPPELGRVEVRLSIDSSGKAQASLSADQPRTLDLLKTDAPALTRALRDAGLNVAQNGLNFSLRGQDRQNGSNGSTPRSGRASQLSLIATSAIGSVQGGANFQGPADGRLDIRV
jgi:chemotaxis protein MotD